MTATVAQLCLERDDGKCFRCGSVVIGRSYDCHHRLFKSAGGPDTLDNRIILCGFGNNPNSGYCHGYAHGVDRKEAERQGWVISRYDERPPSEVPVRHWQLGMVFLTVDGAVNPWAGEPIEETTDG